MCVCVLAHAVQHAAAVLRWGCCHQERHAMCEREFARWQRDNKEATAKAEAHDAGGARPAVNGASWLPQVAHVWSG
jgi:hypothetical protein